MCLSAFLPDRKNSPNCVGGFNPDCVVLLGEKNKTQTITKTNTKTRLIRKKQD